MNEMFSCDDCQKVFTTLFNLNRHKDENCPTKKIKVKKLHICNQCGIEVSTNQILKRHKQQYCKGCVSSNLKHIKLKLKKNSAEEIFVQEKEKNQLSITNVENFENQSQIGELITMIKNLQKQIEEKDEKIQKQIEDVKNKQIVSTQNIATQNIAQGGTIVINNYFNKDLDLYDLTIKQKGEEFARNYYGYTIHQHGRYFEPIFRHLIEPNPLASPIQVNDKNQFELHRSATEFECDEIGSILEKETKEHIERCSIKAYNDSNYLTLIKWQMT
jgi:hypothetical protein